MAITEDLVLDLTAALAAVNTIEQALTASAQQFSVALAAALEPLNTIVIPDADASAVTDSIDAAAAAASPVVDVQADASGVTAQVDAAVAAADSVIAVDADVSTVTPEIEQAVRDADTTVTISTDGDAEDSLQGIAAAANESKDALNSAGSSATIFSAATGILSGNAKGAASSIGSISDATGAVIGVTAAAAATMYLLASAAADAEASEKRFTRATGDMGAQIRQVDIGGLNEDLSTLATRTGNTDELLFDAAGRAFTLAEATGVSREQAALYAEQLEVLAIRARGLNQDLPEAGDVVDSLTRALASGRATALIPYGISLDSTEVKAHAVALGLAATEDSVSKVAASVAAADLAFRGVADAAGDIDAAADSTQAQLRVLRVELAEAVEAAGGPILGGFRDIIEDLTPLVVALAVGVGHLAEAAMPLLVSGVGLAVDILRPLLELFTSIPTPLLQTALGVFAAAKAYSLLATVLETVVVNARVAKVMLAETGVAEAGAGLLGLVNPMTAVFVGVAALGSAFLSHRADQAKTKQAIDLTTKAFQDQSKAVSADISAALADKLGPVAGRLTELGLSFADVQNAIEGGQGPLAEYIRSQIEIGRAFGDSVAAAGPLVRALVELDTAQQGGAQRTLEVAVAAGTLDQDLLDLTLSLNTSAEGTTNYVAALLALEPTMVGATSSVDEFGNTITQTPEQIQAAKDALASAQDALKSFTDDFASGLDGIRTAEAALKDTAGLKTFVTSIQEQVEKARRFLDAIKELQLRGADDLAAELAATGLAGLRAAEQAAFSLDAVHLAQREKDIEAARSTRDAVVKEAEKLGPELKTTAKASVDALTEGIGGSSASAAVFRAAESLFSGQQDRLNLAARRSGSSMGRAFADGASGGVGGAEVDLHAAGAASFRAAESGFRTAGEITSPSRATYRDGQKTAQGWAGGINDESDAPAEAAKKTAKKTIKAASDELQKGAIDLAKQLLELQSPADDIVAAFAKIGPALLPVLAEFQRGGITVDRFTALTDRLGVSGDTLIDVLREVRSEVDAFVQSAVDGLPDVEDAFRGVSEDTSLSTFLTNVRTDATRTAEFLLAIATLVRRGADDLARAFLEAGMDAAGFAAAQAARLSDSALRLREGNLESQLVAEQRNRQLAANLAQGLAVNAPVITPVLPRTGQNATVTGAHRTTNITVNEVAQDPQATAFAVSARQGDEAHP